MPFNLTQTLINSRLVAGNTKPGNEIALRIDQTLTQDVLGTMVMLELEAMGLDRVRTELSAQYVDHNLLQADFRNADDHLFLRSACQRFGLWYSKPGNGVSHPVHMQRFGSPGKTLLGSDSHTAPRDRWACWRSAPAGSKWPWRWPASPSISRCRRSGACGLVGELPDWVSAKDVILEMLRRHDVKGGLGRIIEYYGPGLASLSAMDRHVIANMGAELGATTTVFPSDDETRRFLASEGREHDWIELTRRRGRARTTSTKRSTCPRSSRSSPQPSSPGNVVPVREVAGAEIYQAYDRFVCEPRAPRLRHRRAHRRGQADTRPRLLRRQPHLAPDPRDARRRGLPARR